MIRMATVMVGLVLATAAGAQDAASPAPAAKDPQHALQAAYQKEYAFLVAQKRELEQRLKSFRSDSKRKERQLEGEAEKLESELLGMESEAQRVNEQLSIAEQALESRSGDSGILEATLEQAGASLKDAGFALAPVAEEPTSSRISRSFATAIDALRAFSRVRTESGEFFLADGRQTSGQIVHYGRIASFGIADEAAGALAPAGGGALKLWPEADAAQAQALANGEEPASLGLFLIENRHKEVADSGSKTPLEVIESGGAIAWIIVALGVVALLLALLRVAFLKRASANTRTLAPRVTQLVAAGKLDEAQALCRQSAGATAKVVGATVRNLDRDPKHLDDIISESILGESDYLDRFGSLLLVVAAISPLLGLLGTVTGMISTFDVITEFGTGDPKLLSGGISTALVTTELGLIVAIPTLLIGNILSGWAERIKDDMEKAALGVVNSFRERGVPA